MLYYGDLIKAFCLSLFLLTLTGEKISYYAWYFDGLFSFQSFFVFYIADSTKGDKIDGDSNKLFHHQSIQRCIYIAYMKLK